METKKNPKFTFFFEGWGSGGWVCALRRPDLFGETELFWGRGYLNDKLIYT